LKIKSIQINEIIPRSGQYTPATILAYFYYLEKGGADAACKACWAPLQSQPGTKTNCFNNSLDGLVDPVTFGTRAAWWTYKYYNLSLKNRINSSSTNQNVVSFANYDTHKIKILLGYFGDKKPSDVGIKLSLSNINSVPNFSSKRTVNVKITTIPNTGETVITNPTTITIASQKIVNGNLSFQLPKLNLKEAYLVEIN